jgi:hypothetical protein
MKPLPIQPEAPRSRSAAKTSRIQSDPLGFKGQRLHPSPNTRNNSEITTTYRVLLVLSILLAGVFCWLYLTKPVVRIVSAKPSGQSEDSRAHKGSENEPALLPGSDSLPGDTPGTNAPPPTHPDSLATAEAPSGPVNRDEETNLKIQHVLSATSPDGEIGRVVTEVPVLYQSRTLRWKPSQVAQARALLGQMRAHREKVRSLRAEGMMLANQWQNLLARSIPSAALRADSPTLPINQSTESGRHGPAGLETSESIEVKTADNQ